MAVVKKTKKVAKKAAVAKALSGDEIAKVLASAHRNLARATLQINLMLTTRRMSRKRIEESTAAVRSALLEMEGMKL